MPLIPREHPDLLGADAEDNYLRYSVSHPSVNQADDRIGRLCAPGSLYKHYEDLFGTRIPYS